MRVARRPGRDRGFALIATLWVVMVLGLLTHNLLSTSVIGYKSGANGWLQVAMERDAQAGFAMAVLGMSSANERARWPVDASIQEVTFNGAALQISMEDLMGRLDLNAARYGLLLGLLDSLIQDRNRAKELADRIETWRSDGPPKDDADADTSEGTQGPYRFHSVDELAFIEGVDEELLARLRPLVTVHSLAPGLDPGVASLAALQALPGMTPARARNLIAERRRDGPLPPALDGSRAYEVTIRVSRAGATGVWIGVARLSPQLETPYVLLDWRRVPSGSLTLAPD